ncbi:glycosyltransferase family 4 protein [Faecalibacillus intestinalis]|mgnify:CR=1 FL=1|jgi:1,2-diacylglycerol 3-alpha-glucosyltransferase|uniref:glycosyltransferase family 4 protein n=1 Tax=Faecalibacillus intestinalis TaxID=1982626 RepID=UPI003521F24D
MKILHLMLACFYIDNYSYQENYLPKYHKKQGNDVEIIASLFTFDKNGNGTYLEKECKYKNEYGIRVTRLNYKKTPFSKRLRHYTGLKEEIERFTPDCIFCHGVQFSDIKIVRDYCKKNPKVKLYIDNHSDFSNSATNILSKKIQHEIIWKHYAQMINPYVNKFYGVLPARVDFLINEYKLPKNKVELLVMGADDDCIKNATSKSKINSLRKKYKIKDDDFLIVTGGKIDKWKTQTLLLMKAVKELNNPHVKLLIFGSITEDLQSYVYDLVDGIKIQYVGWIPATDSYEYFAASDLVVFPGRHSVFWEQVVAQGKPMIVKYWDGTTHVDLGGNVKFLYEDSSSEIKKAIEYTLKSTNYNFMKTIAEKGKLQFSYSEIAKKSIEEL